MPRAAPLQSNFNAGEFSKLAAARVTLDQYKTAGELCQNFLPVVQGPLVRRGGTNFVSEVKTSSLATRVVRFEFSTTQAYILEFGNLYLRFYKNHAQILSGPAYEIVTPYATADLMTLQFTQSADVLYVGHKTYPQQKITRTGDTAWTITPITFLDGPYLVQNTTATTFTPSATTGAITITASATTGVNGGAGFQAADIGRLVRIKNGATWGYATITGITSTTIVSATVNNAFAANTAATTWRLGLWGTRNGYPSSVIFNQDRLYWGGCPQFPQRADGSNSGDYENMAPTALDGTVPDSYAVALTLNASDVNQIRWMLDDEKGLLIGTNAGEWLVRGGSTTTAAITPSNVAATQSTKYGSANVQAGRVGRAVLFVQRSGRKVREMAYVYQDDGFRSPDMTLLSEHITLTGVTQMAYQQEPQSVMWMTRTDGQLIAFTYNREQSVLGWSRHILGGFSDVGRTTAAVVESVAVIPEPNGTYDELWMVVRRYINGGTKRYIEYMRKPFEDGDAQNTAWYVDAGLQYNGAPATVISGLSHLIGETVSILSDGGPQPTQVVNVSGQVTLPYAASVVNIGLGFTSDYKTLRPEAGAADGTSQGKTKRIKRLGVRLLNTLGLKIGPNTATLTPIQFVQAGALLGVAPPLFTGDKSVTFEGDYDLDGQVYLRADQPTPCIIVAVMPQLDEQDR